MNNIEKLQNIFKELRKDDEEGHSSAYELQWEDIQAIENLIIENKELKKQIPSPTNPIPIENQTDIWVLKRDYISKSKIKEKIEELDKRIDYLDKELTEAYIQREKLGTETELGANEQYIYNMEQERSIRHTEKYAYLKLLEEGE